MIVVDTSALIAILQDESEADQFMAIIAAASMRLLAATTLMEASLVIAGRGGAASLVELDQFVGQTPFFLRFGKGRHPTGLNFGDCASYALAKWRDLPLPFKGDDFSRTDIGAAA